MPDRDEQSSKSDIRTVIRDLEIQQRRNGWLLTAVLLSGVAFFRWLNEAPYAANSVYILLVLCIIAIRGADNQLTRTVSHLARLVADRD